MCADEAWVPPPSLGPPPQPQMYVPMATVLQPTDGGVPAPHVPVPSTKVEVSDAADMLLALSGGQQDPSGDPSLEPSKVAQGLPAVQVPPAQVPAVPAPQVPTQVRYRRLTIRVASRAAPHCDLSLHQL